MVGVEADGCGWGGLDYGFDLGLFGGVVDPQILASSDCQVKVIVAEPDINRIDLPKHVLALYSPLLRPDDVTVFDFKLPVVALREAHDRCPAIDSAEERDVAPGLHPAAVELRKSLDLDLPVVLGLGDDQVGQLAEVDEGHGGLDGAKQQVREAEAAGGGLAGQLELGLEDRVAVQLPELDEVVEAQGHQHVHLPDPEQSADGSRVVSDGGCLRVLTLNCHYLA